MNTVCGRFFHDLSYLCYPFGLCKDESFNKHVAMLYITVI